MLIAQALGEYAALSAVIDAFNAGTVELEEFAGQWATEVLITVVLALLVWRVITAAAR
jgi:hypothetical protein